ncbi:MAG TPA: hypothetical protein DDY58_15360 [Terrisporobacter glycolicus]|uniref:hypothetical protein n=1 Tax=Terrisporobacter TaxID=1505652 RepID=UPI000E9905C6|nr:MULTISPECIES: hypothetical protein [Terrisporobacter]HBI93675.1 hypothetical protein [Terrisporobacter hibernicus]
MEESIFDQYDIREWIESSLGSEIMVPIWGPFPDKNLDIYIKSYIIDINDAKAQLDTDTYDISGLKPGFSIYGILEDKEVIYERYNSSIKAEPIVINRSYDGLADDNYEIVEEFRLLFNLYYKFEKQEYIDLINDITVVKINSNSLVQINKKYLKQYLAVKNMALILHVDSRYTLPIYDNNIKDKNIEYKNDEQTIFYTLNILKYSSMGEKKNCSLMYGKKIIYGCELIHCGIWPYSENIEYESFIIGMDENGNDIVNTCDPDKLSNFFGANPGMPHYLTPVYFEPEVLNKYYSKPERYTVKDGIIECGNLWSLYIDNQNTDYVSVYLGDLGRDLPNKKEQLYWKSYNKAIDGTLSTTKIKRDFMAEFTNPESIDFIFKNKYVEINKLFNSELGWKLFLDLNQKDMYNFEGLRIPKTNSIVEMDMLTLSLVKVLIDSLNEKQILKQLTGTYEKLNGGISRLEKWLEEKNLQNYQEHIKFLRDLQDLRSTGTGHRKGKKYEKISAKWNVSTGNYDKAFSNILKYSVEFLDYIIRNIDMLKNK